MRLVTRKASLHAGCCQCKVTFALTGAILCTIDSVACGVLGCAISNGGRCRSPHSPPLWLLFLWPSGAADCQGGDGAPLPGTRACQGGHPVSKHPVERWLPDPLPLLYSPSLPLPCCPAALFPPLPFECCWGGGPVPPAPPLLSPLQPLCSSLTQALEITAPSLCCKSRTTSHQVRGVQQRSRAKGNAVPPPLPTPASHRDPDIVHAQSEPCICCVKRKAGATAAGSVRGPQRAAPPGGRRPPALGDCTGPRGVPERVPTAHAAALTGSGGSTGGGSGSDGRRRQAQGGGGPGGRARQEGGGHQAGSAPQARAGAAQGRCGGQRPRHLLVRAPSTASGRVGLLLSRCWSICGQISLRSSS